MQVNVHPLLPPQEGRESWFDGIVRHPVPESTHVYLSYSGLPHSTVAAPPSAPSPSPLPTATPSLHCHISHRRPPYCLPTAIVLVRGRFRPTPRATWSAYYCLSFRHRPSCRVRAALPHCTHSRPRYAARSAQYYLYPRY